MTLLGSFELKSLVLLESERDGDWLTGGCQNLIDVLALTIERWWWLDAMNRHGSHGNEGAAALALAAVAAVGQGVSRQPVVIVTTGLDAVDRDRRGCGLGVLVARGDRGVRGRFIVTADQTAIEQRRTTDERDHEHQRDETQHPHAYECYHRADSPTLGLTNSPTHQFTNWPDPPHEPV